MFCQLDNKDMDPFLAQPHVVRDFLISKFQGNEMTVGGQNEPLFRRAYNFYSDNLARICKDLDWHLKASWIEGPLKDCKEMEQLVKTALSCDERLLSDDLALKLSPYYTYSKFRMDYSEDAFWERQFIKDVLRDVSSKALNVSVAASGLGVTAEMIYYAVKRWEEVEQEESNNPEQEDNEEQESFSVSVKEYVSMGYGSKVQFWKEQSTLDMLEDVRNRNTSAGEVAAQLGVSRREVLNRCGGVKEEAEIEAEKTLVMMKKMKKKAEQDMNGNKKPTQLEMQIKMAEKDQETLSNYEKMRLKNMKERQALVESLDFEEDKREMRTLAPKNQPRKVQVVQLREKSARVKRRSEVQQLKQQITETGDFSLSNQKSSKALWVENQEQRSSPKWFGCWVPRVNKSTSYKRTQVRVTDIDMHDVYDEEALCRSNNIPQVELFAPALLEITSNHHKSEVLMDSITAETKQIEEEQKLSTKVDWNKFELVQDSIVSTSQLTSLDSYGDFICYGTQSGGVGLSLGSNSFTLRPHNRPVTRTVFMGSKSTLRILSAGLDGTVRMTDLGQQSVCLEYSWDQSYQGKQGVHWVEKRGIYSFILDCGAEINQIDIRSKEAVSLIQLPDEEKIQDTFTNLSVNPSNKNLISFCRGQSVQIWDLRRASKLLHKVTSPSTSHMVGTGWSVGGTYLVTCQRRAVDRYNVMDVPVVYPGLDVSQPLLTWEGPRQSTFSPSTGVTWCPWEESLFLTTSEQPVVNVGGGLQLEPKQAVIAVDCNNRGKVVGEISSGLDNSNYLVHCHKTRQVVVVGNSKGKGGLAVFAAT
eukprot:GFUD01026373.1.p1 GENE.GFUD01026373.1~~GFUD01026373.1.p1  ORF type:complete len:860 (+),score=265.23 GFUD01026373.1:148-2580(+)